jgi:hypothetical protein
MKVRTLASRPVEKYSVWHGTLEDGRLIYIFLAHSVLHVSIYTGEDQEGITYRKPVECPGDGMLREEMMRQLDLEWADRKE